MPKWTPMCTESTLPPKRMQKLPRQQKNDSKPHLHRRCVFILVLCGGDVPDLFCVLGDGLVGGELAAAGHIHQALSAEV